MLLSQEAADGAVVWMGGPNLTWTAPPAASGVSAVTIDRDWARVPR